VFSVLPQITGDTELLIVDNASADETPKIAARLEDSNPFVTVCREIELGLSAARNTALVQARGKFVVFLDDDAAAEPGWLDAYRQFIGRPPSGNIAAAGGAVIPRYETLPPAWLDPRAHELRGSDRPHPFDARGGPWGCNFAVHRTRAIQAGGFNPAYGRKGRSMAAHEETDLFQRLNRAGYQVWWVPEARIRHWVAKERLTLSVHCRNMFSLGRSTARLRQQDRSGKLRRGGYFLVRLAVAPFHIVVCLLGGLAMVLLRQVRIAANMLFRSIRIAGFAYQLAREAVGIR
jgi:glycosyltransferase involved in cell wall biosynthesis